MDEFNEYTHFANYWLRPHFITLVNRHNMFIFIMRSFIILKPLIFVNMSNQLVGSDKEVNIKYVIAL